MALKKTSNLLGQDQQLTKLMNYCAYQERCWSEVKLKMLQLAVQPSHQDAMLHYLKENNYVDEMRFCSAVIRGKFNQKKWGRLKIIHELRSKQIDEQLIKQTLEIEIDIEVYEKVILELFQEKVHEYKDEKPLVRKDKAIKFIMNKGFEYNVIERAIKDNDVQLRIV